VAVLTPVVVIVWDAPLALTVAAVSVELVLTSEYNVPFASFVVTVPLAVVEPVAVPVGLERVGAVVSPDADVVKLVE
jgi:hypothetical protein